MDLLEEHVYPHAQFCIVVAAQTSYSTVGTKQPHARQHVVVLQLLLLLL